jgi:hypothetical protein
VLPLRGELGPDQLDLVHESRNAARYDANYNL